ncbi:MAG: bacteriohemerythrin [Sterolibacteriaceae bacterium MAG5]|nr:bacteriohemerythrin [Candidatus Nitricoxidireducens bremensis]
MVESPTHDQPTPWKMLFLGVDAKEGAFAALAELKFRHRGYRAVQAETLSRARELLAAADFAVIVVASAQAVDAARLLREEFANWETSLVLMDGVATGPEELEQLLAYNLGPVVTPRFDAAEMARALAIATSHYETRVAGRRIADAVDELLSAPRLADFATRALVAAGHVPGVPAHRLFCIADEAQKLEFAVAGTGRHAHVTAGPAIETVTAAVHQRLLAAGDGAAAASGRPWDVWRIPADDETLLFYFESDDGAPLHIDRGLQALFCKQVMASHDHIAALGHITRAHKAVVTALSDLAEYKDNETGEHVLRVARMTDEIAWVLQETGQYPELLTDDFLEQVGTASILHDVGKVAVPDRILLKPGGLDADERRAMETHAAKGGAILAKAARLAQETHYLTLAAQLAECHHEQFDGSGYPRGLSGQDIPLGARIVAVVDVFDALTNKRPYKEPWPEEKAVAYIRDRAGTQFDPVVVDAFATVMKRRSSVQLVEWTAAMSVGETVLDEDHVRLIGLLNQLATALVLGNRNIVEYVLDELLFYVRFHFEREETHMQAIGFPGTEEHRQLHKRFADKVAQVRWQYHRGLRAELSADLLGFLTDWLFSHIMGADKAYQRFQEGLAGQTLADPSQAEAPDSQSTAA